MTRNEQEMSLWAAEYSASRLISRENRATEADAAVAEFRKRYPPQPQTPEAVWYDEPPFEKDGEGRHCWVECVDSPQVVYWSETNSEWRRCEGIGPWRPLAGRRVSPIHRPQEPNT